MIRVDKWKTALDDGWRWRGAIVAVLTVAVVARLAFLWVVIPRMSNPGWDNDAYLLKAAGAWDGTWKSVDREPTYVFLCALLQLLPGNDLAWARTSHIAMDAGIVGLILLVGSRLAGRWAALAGGLLYAVYPLALWRIAFVGSDTMATLALTALIIALERLTPSQSSGRWFAVGLGFGVMVLLKQVYKFLPGVLLLYWLWRYRNSTKEILARFAVFAVAAAVVITPWTYRNYRVAGEFIPVAAGLSGLAMLVGNHVPSQGRWEGETKELWVEAMETILAENPGMSPNETDKKMTAFAVQHVRENFTAWLPVLPKKALRFWFVSASETKLMLCIAVQLAYLGIAAIGAWRRPDLLHRLWLPGLVILYTWGLYTLSYSCIRFSLIAMPWLCLVGGWILAGSRSPTPTSNQT